MTIREKENILRLPPWKKQEYYAGLREIHERYRQIMLPIYARVMPRIFISKDGKVTYQYPDDVLHTQEMVTELMLRECHRWIQQYAR